MAPQITPPPRPHVPRQTYDPSDPYGLSSLYAELSSINADLYYYSYSYDSSYYSSLLADLSSLYPSYTYSLPDFYSTAAPGQPNAFTNPTDPSRPVSGDGSNSGGSGGLSTGAKIGIGVGVPLAIAFLLGIGIFLWCAGKRKGKENGTTFIQPPQPQSQSQPAHFQPPVQQVQPQFPSPNQGYMPVYQQVSPPQAPSAQAPPQYAQHPQQPGDANVAYSGYAKGPEPGVVELEQEYHFARNGAVEMGDGAAVQAQKGGK